MAYASTVVKMHTNASNAEVRFPPLPNEIAKGIEITRITYILPDINYENLEAFLCNECGFCQYGHFEYTLTAKPNFAVDPIETDEGLWHLFKTSVCESAT